jgi:branched-chain amino acid transport system permease protein
VGIPTRRIRIQALGLASALGGLAAILTGFDTDLTPDMGFRALLLGVVATVVGGAGSLPGSLLGGLLVGLIQHLGAWFLSTQWQDALIFGLLICFLLWWPRGLLGATTGTRGM